MARKSSRKLFLFGRYSLALLLPKKWLVDLGAKRGQMVPMEYDRARRRIVLRFSEEAPKQVAKRKENPAKNQESTGLQPIPEL